MHKVSFILCLSIQVALSSPYTIYHLQDGSCTNSNLPFSSSQIIVLDKAAFSCPGTDGIVNLQRKFPVPRPKVDALPFLRNFILKISRSLITTYNTAVICGVPQLLIQICELKQSVHQIIPIGWAVIADSSSVITVRKILSLSAFRSLAKVASPNTVMCRNRKTAISQSFSFEPFLAIFVDNTDVALLLLGALPLPFSLKKIQGNPYCPFCLGGMASGVEATSCP